MINRYAALSLGTMALLLLASSAAIAQQAPPTFQGDPSVYKVIYEDQNFRVIDAVRKKGVNDKLHGHPLPSIVYTLTDCSTQLYDANGKAQGAPRVNKAGTAQAAPVTAGHSAENVGPADCHQVFVERK